MSSEHFHVVILAGGQGSRFWPVSRLKRPKQFLSIASNGESLIQATARRVEEISGKNRQWIITNTLHKDLIEKSVKNAHIVCEPTGRNTAASIGLAAVFLQKADPKAVMLVLPADHAVSNEKLMLDTVLKALEYASRNDSLVTIGITPKSPQTAYGYIKRAGKISDGVFAVSRFFEKPNLERATKYLESGEFYWNSGMFAWSVDSILSAIKQYLPAMHEGLMKIEESIGTSKEEEVLQEIFPTLEAISIDFAILEHAKNCTVVSAPDFGWNDVGSWDAWAEHFEKDDQGNLLHGDVMIIDSKNCVVHSEKRMAAVIGADNLIVIDAGDALLVCPREHVQDVRKVVEELKKQGRKELI
jgi:mannose-1-phosphate guanylyltransferase